MGAWRNTRFISSVEYDISHFRAPMYYSLYPIRSIFIYVLFFLVNKVRLVTLQLSVILLKQLVYNGYPGQSVLKDLHLAMLEVLYEQRIFLSFAWKLTLVTFPLECS